MNHVTSLRNRKHALRMVQELDAFPKVPESYQETSATGGGMSVVVFIIIIVLVVSEIRYYASSQFVFDYDVDSEFQGKLRLNIDIIVAMKCAHVGADVLDQTGQNTEMFGHLQEEEVSFELSPKQINYFKTMHHINSYLREEYHTLHEFLWRTGFSAKSSSWPKWDGAAPAVKDGCRFHGSLTVNKVAGNFHVTAGKSVPVFPRGHAHLSMMMKESDYNFSHRIIDFSFGERVSGIVNPLDGEEKLTSDHNHMYQYFLQVVPTKVDTTFSVVDTYQYAATESNRSISHSKGSHGVPGIFMKYDLSSLRVHIRESHQPFWQFIVRLCGIIGGIFATSGMLNLLVGALVDVLCCRFQWGSYSQHNGIQRPATAPATPTTHSASANPMYNNSLSEPVHLVTGPLPATFDT